MLPTKQFIYFIVDTPSGKAYYRDSMGTVSTSIITAPGDVSLKNAPLDWLDTELSFDRNATYHGINRSYSTSQEFVRDAATIIKELFLLGVGTEVPLTLIVFKYNSQPQAGEPNYKLYFKANLDLPNISETVLESLSVNLMEGGVTQLLKNYEGTTVQIPCDGSIAENQKVNLDGLLVPDVFYYQITPVNDVYEVPANAKVFSPFNCVFINNEGDNYGIIHNDQTFEFTVDGVITDYTATSVNYLFLSDSPITVTVNGNITVRFNKKGLLFDMYLVTNMGQLIKVASRAGFDNGTIVISFNQNITLAANESLFFIFNFYFVPYGGETGHNVMDFLGGSFSLSFVSQAKATRAWGITAMDLFKLIVKEICLLASTTDQVLNYQASSNLLSNNLNLFVLSGDSLRASGDSSYQRFYSIQENNQILQTYFGPVIKISLKDFFQSFETVLCAEMSGSDTVLSIEQLESIFNSDEIDFEVGELASLKWSFAQDLGFSDLEIGYAPQTYDQKAGKYEYNTTLEMKAPIKTFSKKLSKISRIRWDSYGIEKLRSNTGEATSTTRNDSDNSVFGVNVDLDPAKTIFDYYEASFVSPVPDPGNVLNTNINFQQNVSCQQIPASIFDGEYFQPNTDNAIVMFSVVGYSATESCVLSVDGIINSENKPPLAPIDSFTLKLWHNGVVIYTYTVAVAGVNTPISISYSFSETFAYKDWIYISMETSGTGVANINTAQLSIGTYVIMNTANVPVLSGTTQKLLSWISFAPTSKPYTNLSVVQYGFQYFVFNSIVPNTNFILQSFFYSWVSNQNANFEVDCIINDTVQSSIVTGTVPGVPLVNSIAVARDYALNDIVFFTGSMLGASLNVSMTSFDIKFYSTQIKCFALKRVQYDSLSGIPNLAGRTDVAGAPYNIEQITPKTLYYTWQNYIMSCFMDKVTGDMSFQTLSKNQFLARTYQGQTIIENSNEPILGFKRLFYPINLEVKTNVPIGFAEIMNKTRNAHIHATFMGTDIYFFANSLTQKPALNESQVWKAVLSPKTDLTAFAKINSFKIPDMSDNSISYAFSNGVQLVPYNQTLADKYHTRNRDTFLFADQIGNWVNQDNYGQPVQIGDPLPFQFITLGLSNITYTVFNNADDSIYLTGNATVKTSPAVTGDNSLWELLLDTTSWNRADYYIIFYAAGSPVYKSELLLLRDSNELDGTVLIEATNSFNTQGIVFDTGFSLSMRVLGGFDNKFKQKYLGKFYIDQPQDITILNAIPYEVTTFAIGRMGGIPDYVTKKVMRHLLLDGCTLDGEGYSINEGAEFQEIFTKGAPMKFQGIEIRPTKNNSAISVVAGQADNDSGLIVSVNSQSFGPNISNESLTTENDLIEITIS